MSIFGPVDDADRRGWQQRNLKALTQLVQLGAKQQLPPLFWTLPDIGDVAGKFQPLGKDHDPRKVFEAWYDAVSKLRGVERRRLGFRGDGEHRDESTRDGKTRMIAAFTLRLPEGRCDMALIAEWFAEDLVQAVEQ